MLANLNKYTLPIVHNTTSYIYHLYYPPIHALLLKPQTICDHYYLPPTTASIFVLCISMFSICKSNYWVLNVSCQWLLGTLMTCIYVCSHSSKQYDSKWYSMASSFLFFWPFNLMQSHMITMINNYMISIFFGLH